MMTTVLGIRLTKDQRDRLKAIGEANRMSEVELARFLIEKAIDGTIKVEKGRIV